MASTPTRDLQEEFLAATRKSQESVVRAVKTWIEMVRTVTPKLPSVYAPLADRLPELPLVAVPFADKLPTPEDVVASGYDFAEHLLALQRKFAEDLLIATEPLIPGIGRNSSATQASTAKALVPKAESKPAAPKAELKPAVPQSAPSAQSVKAAPSAPAAPKPAADKPAPKTTPATRAPRSTAAKSTAKPVSTSAAKPEPASGNAAKPAAAPRAPKNTDAS